jgi:ribonuclease HII
MRKRAARVIGIDEVGRGALAGPVVVAAALLLRGITVSSMERETHIELRDSKKLTPKQRERWAAYFEDNSAIAFSIARVYPRRIEKMNISRAANLAALRAYRKLMVGHGSGGASVKVFLDGGLFLGNGERPKNAKTIVKADEKIPAVAIASIVAKVHRDRYLRRLARKYPAYGFDLHKGYGTKAHYRAIRKCGLSEVHRRTFCHE